MRTAEEISQAQQSLFKKQILSAELPPGFKIGFKLTLVDDHTVTVGVGLIEVAGRKVKQTTEYILTMSDWLVTLIGMGTYYIYLTSGGIYKVDSIAPETSNQYYAEYHPMNNTDRYIGKIITDINGNFIQVVNGGAIVTGDVDTTSLTTVDAIVAFSDADPDYGATRVYIDREGVYLQWYDGSDWITYMQLGGEEVDYVYGTIFPYSQSRGVVLPGAVAEVNALDIGDTYGSGNLFKFEVAVTDQNGANPWDTNSNTTYTTEAKFGTYALVDDAADGYLKDNDAASMAPNNDFTMDWWDYIPEVPTSTKDLFKLKTVDSSCVHANGTKQTGNAAASVIGHGVSALTSNKIVIAYIDSGGDFYPHVKVGTIAGTTVTFGLEYDVISSVVLYTVRCAALGSAAFVAAWIDGNNDLKARVGTVSGTVVTWGDIVTLSLNAGAGILQVSKLDSTHFAIAWDDDADGHGRCTIGTISGTTITFGSDYEFNAVSSGSVVLCSLDSTHFVVAYDDTGGDTACHCKVGVVSSSTVITYGAEYEPEAIAGVQDIYGIDSTHFLWVYTATNAIARYCTVANDDEVSFGASSTILAGAATWISAGSFDASTVFAVVETSDGNPAASKVGDISGTTITWRANAAFNDDNIAYSWCTKLSKYAIATIYNDYNDADACEVIISRRQDTIFQTQAYSNKLYAKVSSFYAEIDEEIEASPVINPGWHHFSINYDQSEADLYFTIDETAYYVDVAAYGLAVTPFELYFYVPTADYRLDDLWIDPATYNDPTVVSIAHYQSGQPWSSDLDYSTDLLIMPEAEGRAYIHNAYLAGFFNKALDLVEDNYTVTDVDGISVVRVTLVNVDKAGTLPTASANKDRILEFILVATGTGDFDVTPEGTETIGGYNAVFKLNAAGQRVRVQSDGSGWEILDCLGTLLEFTSDANVTIAGINSDVWGNPAGHSLAFTPGKIWRTTYFVNTYSDDTGSNYINAFATLHTTNNAETLAHSSRFYIKDDHAAATIGVMGAATKTFDLTIATPTIYYLNLKGLSSAGGALTVRAYGASGQTFIRARRIA